MIPTTDFSTSDPLTSGLVSQGNDAAATAASDFDSFLKLLTAQLRNQDPLAPVDSTQFVEQLASFSSVEQQIKTNTLLQELTASLGVSDLEGATQWIGREVETTSGAARFQGEALDYRLPDAGPGGAVEIVVTTSSGAEVYKERLPAGQTSFSWDGRDQNGETAPIGDYVVSVNYLDGDEVIDVRAPIAVSTVKEARVADGGVKLVLANGAAVDISEITAVRAVSERAADSAGS